MMAKWIWKKYGSDSKTTHHCIEKTSGLPQAFITYYNGAMPSLYESYSFDERGGWVELEDYVELKVGATGWYKHKYNEYYFGKATFIERRNSWTITNSKYLYLYDNTTYSRGYYIGEVIGDYYAYNNDTRNSDGYWYIRDREAASLFYKENKAINKFYNQNKLLKVRQQDKEW